MNQLKRVFVIMLAVGAAPPAIAQNTVRWSGLVYMDYEYLLSSADEDAEGENGFDYRRMYLTADYTLSEEFSGRARLEAASGSSTTYPFVKDLYLKWKGAIGEGHDLVFGVQSPPVFNLSEKMWGYRSLEKTIMDRQRVVSSRDMGVSAAGKLTSDGKLRYGLMLGNNNGVRGEDDKYKRVYGEVSWQSDNVMASVGGDYASGENRQGINTHAFAGYSTGKFRAGVEAYLMQTDFDNSDQTFDDQGVSVWLIGLVNEKTELIGRLDYAEKEAGASSISEIFVIGGVAFSPNPKVHLIPNVYVVDTEGRTDPEIAGRLTVHADF